MSVCINVRRYRQTIILELNESDTILKLIRCILPIIKKNIDDILLIYDDQILNDRSKTLKDIGILQTDSTHVNPAIIKLCYKIDETFESPNIIEYSEPNYLPDVDNY